MAKEDGDKGRVVVITEEMVALMIAAAIKGLATAESIEILAAKGEELQQRITALEGALQLLEAEKQDYFARELLPGTAILSSIAGAPEQPPLDPAWLEGLSFRDATQERRIVEGRLRLVPTVIERELEPGDVMGYRVTDHQVFLVTADGQKYTVEI